MRLIPVVAALTCLPALLVASFAIAGESAAQLTIARLFADPPLSGPAPRLLRVAPDGERVTFVRGRADGQNQLDLWEFAIRAGKERLLVDSALLAPGAAVLSAEEQARRERARTAAFSGIVDYQFAPDGKSILFPLNGALYLYDLRKTGAAAVRRLTRAEDGFATDPKVSPGGRYVSFVRDRALWAIDLQRGLEFVLSPAGTGTVSYATAEFVAQEEMDRLTGYWWAPDDSAVAYTRIDEAPVALERRFEIYADRTEVIEQRYPAAGKANALVELWIATPDPDTAVARDSAVRAPGVQLADASVAQARVDLGPQTDIYLARVNWIDGHRVTFQRQSRDQRRLDLIVHDRRDATQRVLVSESSSTWINLHDDLRFLPNDNAFVWSSERSGLRQLYLYGLDGQLRHAISAEQWPVENVLALDRRKRLIYVHGSGPDTLQKQVFAIPLDAGPAQQLTREDGWHDAVFAANASLFVATHSAPDTPPRVRLHRADGTERALLLGNRLDASHPYHPFVHDHVAPEYGQLQAADGQTLNYAVFKPRGFDPARRYPAIVRYYGGPGRQFVRRDWTSALNTGVTDLLSQYWAQRGYVVFALDNRGTPRRGKVFEDPLHRRMGELEIADQRVGIEWLVAQPWVDRQRVGAFGWSYGGYITLMLLAKANDLVQAGAAVAPVSDWALYDTHYTERYMDQPQANVDGYRAGNVLEFADQIAGRLLLIHGMADDNVLFTNSTALMARLQARAFAFDLMTYPGGKHGLVGAPVRTHVYEAIDAFFARQLQAGRE